MIYKSKRYKPPPKARDVLLTWAQASAYKDEAVEYLELPDLAHDRSIQKQNHPSAIDRRRSLSNDFDDSVRAAGLVDRRKQITY